MIDELIQASESKRLRVPADIEKVESVLNELLTRTREFRSIARILSAHVRLKIGQGKQAEAMDSALPFEMESVIGQATHLGQLPRCNSRAGNRNLLCCRSSLRWAS